MTHDDIQIIKALLSVLVGEVFVVSIWLVVILGKLSAYITVVTFRYREGKR